MGLGSPFTTLYKVTTKKTPYELLMNREVRTKLDHFPTTMHINDQEVRANDRSYKEKCKEYHDKRHNTKKHTLKIGDAVVVKRENKRKAQTPYEPYIYIITYIKGSQIEAKRIKDEKTICQTPLNSNPLDMLKYSRINRISHLLEYHQCQTQLKNQRRLQRRLESQDQQKPHQQPATMFHHPDDRNVWRNCRNRKLRTMQSENELNWTDRHIYPY